MNSSIIGDETVQDINKNLNKTSDEKLEKPKRRLKKVNDLKMYKFNSIDNSNSPQLIK